MVHLVLSFFSESHICALHSFLLQWKTPKVSPLNAVSHAFIIIETLKEANKTYHILNLKIVFPFRFFQTNSFLVFFLLSFCFLPF